MIVEMVTEQAKPRCVPALEERYQAALPDRLQLSPLAAFWKVDVGDVDSVVQLWPYESEAHRESVLAKAAELDGWPAKVDDLVMERTSTILVPTPFSPPLLPPPSGNLYELRIYSYELGTIPTVTKRWQDKIEARVAMSPLVLCGHTVSGHLSRWVHIWAYDDALQRQRTRALAVQQGIWPPDARAGLIRQQNTLLVPTRLSSFAK